MYLRNIRELFVDLPVLNNNKFILRKLEKSDHKDLELILSDPKVREYYFVPPIYKNDINNLLSNFSTDYDDLDQLTWVITDKAQIENILGFVTVEFIFKFHELFAHLNMAIINDQIETSILSESIFAVCDFLKDFIISYLRVDVHLDSFNRPCEPFHSALVQNGFEKDGATLDFVNSKNKHMQYDKIRISFFREVVGRRKFLCLAGDNYIQKGDYSSAISAYNNAFRCEYKVGSPFTDGRIYAHVGILHFSTGHFKEAYQNFIDAIKRGEIDDEIKLRLDWIRLNCPDVL